MLWSLILYNVILYVVLQYKIKWYSYLKTLLNNFIALAVKFVILTLYNNDDESLNC